MLCYKNDLLYVWYYARMVNNFGIHAFGSYTGIKDSKVHPSRTGVLKWTRVHLTFLWQ